MPWYEGPSLLYHLEHVYIGSDRNLHRRPLPGPVGHPAADRRAPRLPRLRGQVAAGSSGTATRWWSCPSGAKTRIKRIETSTARSRRPSRRCRSSMLLEDDIDISRGDMICRPHNQPTVTQELEAMVCWMPTDRSRWAAATCSSTRPATARRFVDEVRYRIDVNTLHRDEDGDFARAERDRPGPPSRPTPLCTNTGSTDPDGQLHPDRRDNQRHGRRGHGRRPRRLGLERGRSDERPFRGISSRVESPPMSASGNPPDGPKACPFVALELDRDRRAERPDYRHRCFAEPTPAPRSIAHQEAYCLSPNFPSCPVFQDWALRAAARPVGAPARPPRPARRLSLAFCGRRCRWSGRAIHRASAADRRTASDARAA